MLREPRARWPRRIVVPPVHPPDPDPSAAVVTFIGHSTFLIQTPHGNLLTDPMYSRRAGPFNVAGPARVRQPAVRFEDLPPVAIVPLSHNHYDHCDTATLRRLGRRFDPLVVTPLRNGALVRSCGLRRVEELDWWEGATIGSVHVAATPARHFSARTPWDRNRALWCGFVVTAAERRIYFAGDTAYADFFSEIPRRLGPLDLALLPIGAYEPRWFMRAVHMNPAEAVRSHAELGAARSVGMHFGTFQLTTEAIDDPERALAAACRDAGLPPSEFGTLGFGESIRLEHRENGTRRR